MLPWAIDHSLGELIEACDIFHPEQCVGDREGSTAQWLHSWTLKMSPI